MHHYVYLYRDEHGQPRYVGYGKLVTRANAHLIKSHNPKLAEFVLKTKFTIEVCGPFESKPIGLLVETTLISALKPTFNVVQGQLKNRLRPLGVPVDFSKRLSMPALQRNEFLSLQGDSQMPVLFVKVGDKDFGDGRAPYNLANPPTDDQILERVKKWWQLSHLAPHWAKNIQESPGLLLGISGSPGSQIVIASLMINRDAWGNTHDEGGGTIAVPLLSAQKLDTFKLRGRRVDRKAKLAFDAIPSGFFIILKRNGRIIGGRRPR